MTPDLIGEAIAKAKLGNAKEQQRVEKHRNGTAKFSIAQQRKSRVRHGNAKNRIVAQRQCSAGQWLGAVKLSEER